MAIITGQAVPPTVNIEIDEGPLAKEVDRCPLYEPKLGERYRGWGDCRRGDCGRGRRGDCGRSRWRDWG